MRAARTLLVLSTLFVLLPTRDARPAGPGLCNAYVEEAMKLSQQVRDNKCGYDLNHPQWSQDPNVHRRWCLSSSTESVDAERESRRDIAHFCNFCRGYAVDAIKAVKSAEANKCQVSGAARTTGGGSSSGTIDYGAGGGRGGGSSGGLR
jgi:hypothetical protein